MKNILFFFLIVVGLVPFLLFAQEISENHSSTKKYKLSVCAIFKNEGRYLKEWVEYHRLIGVDHFYLYNNESKDRSKKILAPYVDAGLVTLIDWPDRVLIDNEEDVFKCAQWALSTQLPAYENAVKVRGIHETDWMVILDVDEFLVPVRAATVGEILENYETYAGLSITSDHFEASRIDVLPRRELLISHIELTAKPVQKIQKGVEKIIFRPDFHTSFVWPPYRCNFRDGASAVKLSKGQIRINKYVNRYKGVLHFGKRREKLHVDNRLLTEDQLKELLEVGFEIEDKERAIHRFESQLSKKMGLATGWEW